MEVVGLKKRAKRWRVKWKQFVHAKLDDDREAFPPEGEPIQGGPCRQIKERQVSCGVLRKETP